MVAPFVVEGALLAGALDTARGCLLDIAVRQLGVVFVLLDVQGDGGEPDGLARQPADALQRETGVGAVREGFVLRVVLASLWTSFAIVLFYMETLPEAGPGGLLGATAA